MNQVDGKPRIGQRGWLFVASGPALLIAALEVAIPEFPLTTGIAIAAISFAAVLAGSVEVENARRHFERARSREKEQIDRLTPPLVPYRVTVVGAKGACPLNFELGHEWNVDLAGGTSRPMCRPAALAAQRLNSTWTEAVAEPDPNRVARCECPWAAAGLAFGAREVLAS